MKQYDAIVVIGRFQGPHIPHTQLLRRAGELGDKAIVIVGSAEQPRTFKNPWTYEERVSMLRPVTIQLDLELGTYYEFEPNIDTLYDDDAWVARVQKIVNKHTTPGMKVGLLGHKKDIETARYLDMFPQWDLIPLSPIEMMDATTIRNLYFSDNFNPKFLIGAVPASTLDFFMKFRETPEYAAIMEEKAVVDEIRKRAALYPYPVVANTCDSIVTHGGHILLIKRRSHPGKGLWALPGGYFKAIPDKEGPADMVPLDGCIRELKEETKIDVPEKVLRGSVVELKTFSHPQRSQLGRSITFAAHIPLTGPQPRVKGADDAEKARWVPFIEVKRDRLFDDHFDIISYFINLQ